MVGCGLESQGIFVQQQNDPASPSWGVVRDWRRLGLGWGRSGRPCTPLTPGPESATGFHGGVDEIGTSIAPAPLLRGRVVVGWPKWALSAVLRYRF